MKITGKKVTLVPCLQHLRQWLRQADRTAVGSLGRFAIRHQGVFVSIQVVIETKLGPWLSDYSRNGI